MPMRRGRDSKARARARACNNKNYVLDPRRARTRFYVTIYRPRARACVRYTLSRGYTFEYNLPGTADLIAIQSVPARI